MGVLEAGIGEPEMIKPVIEGLACNRLSNPRIGLQQRPVQEAVGQTDQ